MKKLFLFLILFITSIITIKADITESPVTFTLKKDFYSEITKTYDNDTTIFTYNNKLLNMDLTDDELELILSQKSGSGSSRLTYYETLNILVKPVEGTPFEVLKNETQFYRANGGGAWVNEIVHNQNLEETANLKNLNNDFWPWGYKLQYRTEPTGTFTSTVPTGVDLTNKTLKEQLAAVLSVDPEDVISEYKVLWKFSPLNNYTYLLRFDFLSKKNGVTPNLKSGDEYYTDSLNNMGTYYVAIKYQREEDAITSLVINESKKTNDLWYIVPSIVLLSGTIVYIIKKKVKVII